MSKIQVPFLVLILFFVWMCGGAFFVGLHLVVQNNPDCYKAILFSVFFAFVAFLSDRMRCSLSGKGQA